MKNSVVSLILFFSLSLAAVEWDRYENAGNLVAPNVFMLYDASDSMMGLICAEDNTYSEIVSSTTTSISYNQSADPYGNCEESSGGTVECYGKCRKYFNYEGSYNPATTRFDYLNLTINGTHRYLQSSHPNIDLFKDTSILKQLIDDNVGARMGIGITGNRSFPVEFFTCTNRNDGSDQLCRDQYKPNPDYKDGCDTFMDPGCSSDPQISDPNPTFYNLNSDRYDRIRYLMSHVSTMSSGSGATTRPGENLIGMWDYFYGNNHQILSCRKNIVIMITDGLPTPGKDRPDLLLDPSNYKSKQLKWFNDPDKLTKFKKYVESKASGIPSAGEVASFIYNGHNEPGNEIRLYHDYSHESSEDPCPGGDCPGNKISVFPLTFVDNSVDNMKYINEIADRSGGEARFAYDKNSLKSAIKDAIVSSSAGIVKSVSPPALVMDGNYFGNIVYLNDMDPHKHMVRGHWKGNMRKFCAHNGESGNPPQNCLFIPWSETNGSGVVKAEKNPGTINELFTGEALADDLEDIDISSHGVNKKLVTRSENRKIYIPSSGTFVEFLPESNSRTEVLLANFMNGYNFGVNQNLSVNCSAIPLPTKSSDFRCKDSFCESTQLNQTIPEEPLSYKNKIMVEKFDEKVGAVEVNIQLEHEYKGEVEIRLTSPMGTTKKILSKANENVAITNLNISTRAFEGEYAVGEWTLEVWDNNYFEVPRKLNYLKTGKTDGDNTNLIPVHVKAYAGKFKVRLDGPENCDDGSNKINDLDLVVGKNKVPYWKSGWFGGGFKNFDFSSTEPSTPHEFILMNLDGNETYDMHAAIRSGICEGDYTLNVEYIFKGEKKSGTFKKWGIKINPTTDSGASDCSKRDNIVGDFWHSSLIIAENKLISGSNAGFLEVIDSETGEEIKAVVPTDEIWNRHKGYNFALGANKGQMFGVDLTPKRIRAKDSDDKDFDYIFTGYGRGGKGFALFETDSLINENTNPVTIFEDTTHHNMLYSTPQLINWGKMEDNTWKGTLKLLVSSGYHENFDNNDIDIATANSDSNIKKGLHWYSIKKDSVIHDDTIGSEFPVIGSAAPYFSGIGQKEQWGYSYNNAEVRNADSVYFGDLAGTIYHIRKDDTTPRKVFSFNESSSTKTYEDRNLFAKPSVIIRERESKKEIWTYFGTSDPTRPIDPIIKNNLIVGIRDQVNKVPVSSTLNLSDLHDSNSYVTNCLGTEKNCAGWYVDLGPNRTVVGDTLAYTENEESIHEEILYFTVYEFNPNSVQFVDTCAMKAEAGRSYLYAVQSFSGRLIRGDSKDNPDALTDLGAGKASQPVLSVYPDGNATIFVSTGTGGLAEIDIWDGPGQNSAPTILWWKVN